MKTCPKCKKNKEFCEFYKRTRSADGLCSLCITCHKLSYNRWVKNNPRKNDPAQQRKWAQKNRLKLNKAKRERYAQKRSSVKAINSKYQQTLKGRASTRHRNAKYRAAKLQALPAWLTKEQLLEIKNIYMNCPAGCHVDHIVPLQGKEVNGLHVPWNLQYLVASENIRKSNK